MPAHCVASVDRFDHKHNHTSPHSSPHAPSSLPQTDHNASPSIDANDHDGHHVKEVIAETHHVVKPVHKMRRSVSRTDVEKLVNSDHDDTTTGHLGKDVAVHDLTNEDVEQYAKKLTEQELTAGMTKVWLEEQTKAPPPWTESNAFGLCVGFVVVLNAIALGVEADYGRGNPLVFKVLENVFCGIFFLELLAHFCVEGPRKYFMDKLNWLDCFLVLSSILDAWIIQPLEVQADLRVLSILRMLRLIRLARLLKLFRVFKELTLLVTGFIESVKTLFWSLIFLLTVVYAFAILAQQTIGLSRDCPGDNDPEVCDTAMYEFNPMDGTQDELFGSVDKSMLTLFVCLTEGCGDVIKAIVLKRPILCVYWLTFTFVTTLGLLNLIVCLLCENALTNAAETEKELEHVRDLKNQQLLADLRAAFIGMDEDGSGYISHAEFNHAMLTNDTVIDAFIELGLAEEENIFNTLDAESNGYLSFNQFFDGLTLIMRGHDSAKAKDIVGTLLTCQAIDERVKRIEDRLCGAPDGVDGKALPGAEKTPVPSAQAPSAEERGVQLSSNSSSPNHHGPEHVPEPAIPVVSQNEQHNNGVAELTTLVRKLHSDMTRGFESIERRLETLEMGVPVQEFGEPARSSCNACSALSNSNSRI